MIRLFKHIEEANAITHAGLFHADEVVATVILSRIREVRLCRVFRVPEDLPDDVLVYDIGMGTYDHHQPGRNGCRESGVHYAACGLIWRDFGRDVIHREASDLTDSEVDSVWRLIDDRFIRFIDAADNGEAPRDDPTALSGLISACNPAWDHKIGSDDAFLEAVALADIAFSHTLANAVSKVRAEMLVRKALNTARPPVLVLDRFMPWQDALYSYERENDSKFCYVIYPAIRGGFNCQCVAEESDLFHPRHAFPEEWRGLKDAALQESSGVEDALFCHPAGFLVSAETQAGAIRLANLALNKQLEK